MTVVGHHTYAYAYAYAYACVIRVNQPLLVQCFILVILGFSIPAFNFGILAFWHSGILAFSDTPGVW